MNEVDKFYEWMLRVGNIHLSDNEGMSNAYNIVYENNN
jgi:hypothetical protein